MKTTTLVCGSLFAIGLVAGSMIPAGGAAGTARTINGYQVLAGDFHVHAFPGDGVLAPWDLAREARREGLDVIAITNHNQMIAAHLAERVPSTDVMVLPGEEVTTPDFHMTGIGLTSTVDWHGTMADVAAAVHAQGGVAIGAHPARTFIAAFDTAAFTALDGIERAHPMMEFRQTDRQELVSSFARAQQVKASIAPIGASDFHYTAAVGLCRTYLFVREKTPAGVLDAIRSGRTVACDQQGNVYGDPVISRGVADLCLAKAEARLTKPPLEWLSLAATWAGLLGLAWVGFRPWRRD